MLVADRQRRILDVLAQHGSSSTVDLAAQFGVAEATIRRDLVSLDREGRLQRVHGGALLVTEHERPFDVVRTQSGADDGREAVAGAAAALVPDGANVILDIGVTTLAVARRLHGRPVTVLTTSLPVITELADDPVVSLVALGGTYRRTYRSFVGFLAEESIRQFRVDLVLLGTSGVLPDGTVCDTTMIEVPLKRAMIAAARCRYLLAGPDKFPGSGLSRVCHLGELDGVVVPAPCEPAARAAVGHATTQVLVA